MAGRARKPFTSVMQPYKTRRVSRSRSIMRNAIRVIFLLPVALVLAFANARVEAAGQPPIRHVFVVVLENQSYTDTFGPGTPAVYFANSLRKQGVLLENYYAIGHASLDNYVAMISGQPPNEDTQRDCPLFRDMILRRPALDERGRAIGRGCVYPPFVKTLADQMDAAHLSWRGYMQDMGKDPARELPTCGHSPIGARETLLTATAKDQYAVKHDPFMYFHSIIDRRSYCDNHVVNLDRLANDLRTAATTPNLVFIVPNLCDDGHDSPCIDGAPGGLISADAFLRALAPTILASPAYRRDGMLVITFDEAGSNGPEDSAACCGEEAMPGAAFPPGVNGPGGGRIGALVLSGFTKPGTRSAMPYNHYSLLRSIEDIFGLSHLALANDSAVHGFGPDVFQAGSFQRH